MKRLTELNVGEEHAYYPRCFDECDGLGCEKPYCDHNISVCDRLAAYEDICFNPDGTERVSMDRLRELVEADKDGRCVILPCMVGDTIYKVCKPCGEPFGIYQEEVGGFAFDGVEIMVCPEWSIDCVRSFANADDFGKTAFLTCEAAGAALEARKCGR